MCCPGGTFVKLMAARYEPHRRDWERGQSGECRPPCDVYRYPASLKGMSNRGLKLGSLGNYIVEETLTHAGEVVKHCLYGDKCRRVCCESAGVGQHSQSLSSAHCGFE